MFDQFLDLYRTAMTPPGVFITIGVQLAALALLLAVARVVSARRQPSADKAQDGAA